MNGSPAYEYLGNLQLLSFASYLGVKAGIGFTMNRYMSKGNAFVLMF